MVMIEIDGKKRTDYEIKELIIVGDSIKISLKKKNDEIEKIPVAGTTDVVKPIKDTSFINKITKDIAKNLSNTGSYIQQNNPVLEIRNKNQPNPSQILCETQAFQGLV